jgi:hypothetical protein
MDEPRMLVLPSRDAPDVIGFGNVTLMSACSHARISVLLK